MRHQGTTKDLKKKMYFSCELTTTLLGYCIESGTIENKGISFRCISFLLSTVKVNSHVNMTFCFLLTQIKSESFLEDLNNILNAGDVPNIFAQDELDTIFSAMKPVVIDLGLQPTKANLYSAFTKRVRANTHSVVCMRYIF